jgi:DNA-binding response OmpR family regulator
MSGSAKILIVEDEPLVSQLIAGEFERSGFTVFLANNGNDGLRLAIEEKPDALILDIVMPGLHGYEVCKKIRERRELDKTVIVMTSAKSYKPDIDKAMQMGADEYVIKPSGINDIVSVVQKHLEKRAGTA